MNSKKIPDILHMIWVGEKAPAEYFWSNLNKWKSLMPNWKFIVWTNDKLATENIDESYIELINKSTSGAQKADILRYYAIKKYGGFYVDADITPIKSLDTIERYDYDVILCHDLLDTNQYIATGFFAAIPNHVLFNNIVKEIYYVDFNNINIHLTTGPYILGKEVGKINWTEYQKYLMLPYWTFYRNRIGDPGPTMPNRIERDHPDAIGHHAYLGTWL